MILKSQLHPAAASPDLTMASGIVTTGDAPGPIATSDEEISSE